MVTQGTNCNADSRLNTDGEKLRKLLPDDGITLPICALPTADEEAGSAREMEHSATLRRARLGGANGVTTGKDTDDGKLQKPL